MSDKVGNAAPTLAELIERSKAALQGERDMNAMLVALADAIEQEFVTCSSAAEADIPQQA
jgi:hypothetical protein